MARKTVGELSLELQQKEPDTRDPIELEREIHKDYEDQILKAVEQGKKDFYGDFFIVVVTKKERLMQNVLRNFFLARETCPSPEYDQTVYHYHRSDEHVEFIWVLPSKDTCKLFKDNVLEIADSEKGLRNFILRDAAGDLLMLSKKLNGEIKDAIVTRKRKII